MLYAHRCISNLVWWLVLGGGTACFVCLFLWPADIQAKTSSSVCKLLFTKADNFKKWLFDRCNLSVSLHTDDLPARKQSPFKYDWSVEPVHSVKLGLGNRSVSSNKTFCHAYRCSYINIQLSDHRDSCSRKKIDSNIWISGDEYSRMALDLTWQRSVNFLLLIMVDCYYYALPAEKGFHSTHRTDDTGICTEFLVLSILVKVVKDVCCPIILPWKEKGSKEWLKA